MYRRERTRSVLVLFLCLFVFCSCSPTYFDPIRTPPEPLTVGGLDKLSWNELWAGIVFNGEKVGFTRLKIVPLPDEGLFCLESEAHLRIRFLGLSKAISMKSEDRVRADLQSVSLRHEMVLDGKTLRIEGRVRDGVLHTVQRAGSEVKQAETKLREPLYPAAAINLYPVLNGLAAGLKYRYDVYDPQTQSVTAVSQTVAGFESSRSLGVEPSWKVKTSMLGQDVETWINRKGEAVFELGMKGVLITHRETENEARRYLSEASLNKKDLILDFSVVKTANRWPVPARPRCWMYPLRALPGSCRCCRAPARKRRRPGVTRRS